MGECCSRWPEQWPRVQLQEASLIGALFDQTPSIKVLDNRVLTVRDVEYLRDPNLPQLRDEQITRSDYSPTGFKARITDPRLHRAGMANFMYQHDLVGQCLRTQSVDSGISLTLNDVARRPLFSVSNVGRSSDGRDDHGQAATRTFRYEHANLPGRPLGVFERVAGEPLRSAERFMYAENGPEEKARNLAGSVASHYDPVGRVQTTSKALGGATLCIQRRLLKNVDDEHTCVDWRGESSAVWESMLDDHSYSTRSRVDATGKELSTLDCVGNRQRVVYDVGGVLAAQWLTLEGSTEQTIVKAMLWSASGRKMHEVHGNHVETAYSYEPRTQRLMLVLTSRTATVGKVLQDLRYRYDPVGNVMGIGNAAEQTRFWRNQKVVPENQFRYDSLYQLVYASGREMANAGKQGIDLPPALAPLPGDDSAYTNYTRRYTYDTSGNLTQIQHSAPASDNSYVNIVTISPRSNRGVSAAVTTDPLDVEALFTAGGHQRQLFPGRHLDWTVLGELRAVSVDAPTMHGERYRYDADSQRVLKVSLQRQGTSEQLQRTLYLPGVELRTASVSGSVKESMQIVTVGEAGRAQVRVLRWKDGKPDGIDNDQIRWGYDNLVGSVGLEVDGDGNIISFEEYYPFGGTAIFAARSQVEADYKTVRYSGRERDATGLYYYGYRYYLPWVGRWLSVDPAGTLDGANLFMMVKNNPLGLKDSAGLSALSANFDLHRGDLVYGLHEQRENYLLDAFGENYQEGEYKNSIMDAYVDTVADFVLSELFPDMVWSDNISGKVLASEVRPGTDILHAFADKVPGAAVWSDHVAFAHSRPKYKIESIYNEVREAWGSSDYHSWDDNEVYPNLFAKRTSKLGVDVVAEGESRRIHFVLDDINISEVIGKDGEYGDSITSSELRALYRKKDAAKGKVHFYRDNQEVPAPWDSAPGLWSHYVPKPKMKQSNLAGSIGEVRASRRPSA